MRPRWSIACTILALSVILPPGRGMCNSPPTIDVSVEGVDSQLRDGAREIRIQYSWETTNCDYVTVLGYNNGRLNPSGQIKLLPGSYVFVAHGPDMSVAMEPVGVDRAKLPVVGAEDSGSEALDLPTLMLALEHDPLVTRFTDRKLTSGWHRKSIKTSQPLGDLEDAVVDVLQEMGYLVCSDLLDSCVFAYTPQPANPRGKKGKPVLAQSWWQWVRDPVDIRATVAIGIECCGYASTRKTHNVYVSASVEKTHLRKARDWLPDLHSAPKLCSYIGNRIAQEVKK